MSVHLRPIVETMWATSTSSSGFQALAESCAPPLGMLFVGGPRLARVHPLLVRVRPLLARVPEHAGRACSRDAGSLSR